MCLWIKWRLCFVCYVLIGTRYHRSSVFCPHLDISAFCVLSRIEHVSRLVTKIKYLSSLGYLMWRSRFAKDSFNIMDFCVNQSVWETFSRYIQWRWMDDRYFCLRVHPTFFVCVKLKGLFGFGSKMNRRQDYGKCVPTDEPYSGSFRLILRTSLDPRSVCSYLFYLEEQKRCRIGMC